MPLLLAIWGFVFLFVFDTAFAVFLFKAFIFVCVVSFVWAFVSSCRTIYTLWRNEK